MQPSESHGNSRVAILGLPSDEHSSFLKGASQAPAKIRNALRSGSMNPWSETGLNVFGEIGVVDRGDLKDLTGEKGFNHITETVTFLLSQGHRLLVLGGDHAITYPVVKGYAALYGPLTLIHLDAHPDLYEEYNGDRFSHASTMARILEDGLVRRLIQVGIRASNSHQRVQARRFGVETHEMKSLAADLRLSVDGPVYLSVDLDVLDPAYAPGVSHLEPGGMSTRELITFIQSLNAPLIGADIVEYNPIRDINGLTAFVAVKLMKELIGRMQEAGNQPLTSFRLEQDPKTR